jgi:hypothetical protein
VRYHDFEQTPLGQRLTEIITAPTRYIEFAAFSREGFPAVTALVSLLTDEMPEVKDNHRAKQFIGWRVGEIMREHGHEMVKRAARVPGNFFTVGAVWSQHPVSVQAGATA